MVSEKNKDDIDQTNVLCLRDFKYQAEYVEAFSRTKIMGISSPEVPLFQLIEKINAGTKGEIEFRLRQEIQQLVHDSPSKGLMWMGGDSSSPEHHEELVLEDIIMQATVDMFSRACLSVHIEQHVAIECLLDCEATLTIGSLEYDGHHFYDMDSANNQSLNVDESGTTNMHVWLTLNTLEIVDLTWSTTMGGEPEDRTKIGKIIGGMPSKLPSDIVYHPMLVGEMAAFAVCSLAL
jgi:hypothetical protein